MPYRIVYKYYNEEAQNVAEPERTEDMTGRVYGSWNACKVACDRINENAVYEKKIINPIVQIKVA